MKTALLLIVVAAASGCGGGGGGGGSDTTAPVIGDATFGRPVTNRAGTITVTVPVSDDASGVAGVEMVVTPAGGTPVTKAMSLVAGQYTASYDYPANVSTSDKSYSFYIRAADRAGNVARSAEFTFVVPSPEAPPPPPPMTP